MTTLLLWLMAEAYPLTLSRMLKKSASGLVYLVCSVYLVCLVCPVYLVGEAYSVFLVN